MSKSIKKRYKILLFGLAATLLLPVFLVLLIRTPTVQTILVNRLTSRMGERINTTISIGSIHFTFFNKIVAKDILLLDTNADTLLYTRELTASIKRISKKGTPIRFHSVNLQEPVFKIIRDDHDQTNLNWYIDNLKRDEKREREEPFNLTVNQISITRGRFQIVVPDQDLSSEKNGIDFNNLIVNDINTIIENFSIENDTVKMSVYRLSFIENSGFKAMAMTFGLELFKGEMNFSKMILNTPDSKINAESIIFFHEKERAFSNFSEDVRMSILLNNSLLSQRDLSYFVPAITHDPGPVELSGQITGPLTELRGRDIQIRAGEETTIACSFDFSGLPDIDNTYIFLDISNLESTFAEMALLGITDPDKISEEIKSGIGKAQFRGTFSGFITDFVTYGRFQTESGTILTDISLRPVPENSFRFGGTIKGQSIDAGKLTGNSELFGESSFNLLLDGEFRSTKEFSATLYGTIDSSVFNGYTYREIKLNGEFTEKRWNGSIDVRDEKLYLDFTGLIDFQQELPNFDFSLNIPYAWLYDLNFVKEDSSAYVNSQITAKFSGNSLESMYGSLFLHKAELIRFDNTLNIEDGVIMIYQENNLPHIALNSNFLDANLTGQYDFATLPSDFITMARELIPSYINGSPREISGGKNSFRLRMQLHDTEEINQFFQTGLDIAEGTEIDIEFSSNEFLKAQISSDHLAFKTNHFEEFTLETDIGPSQGYINMKSQSFTLAGVPNLKQFEAIIDATPDTINSNISWKDDTDRLVNRGEVSTRTVFSLADTIRNIHTTVRESEIFVRNEKWIVNRAGIVLQEGVTRIDNLFVNNRENYFRVSGTLSESVHDSLVVEVSGIDLANLNHLISNGKEGEETAEFSFGGILSGNIVLTSVLSDLMVETDDLIVEDFRMIGHSYGDIKLNSRYDSQKRLATIRLFNELDGMSTILIDGSYDPEDKAIDFVLLANSLPIDLLNPLLSNFASGINGYVTGKVNLHGKLNQPGLTGALFVDNGTITIDYLKTSFHISDSIRFSPQAILFNNINARDERGNPILTNGYLRHNYFKDFEINLTLNPNRAMVLNTTQRDNDIFYGQAFATGVVNIRGAEGNLSFDISARTERNSRFFVPLSSAQSIGDYPFIIFTGSDLPVESIISESAGGNNGGSISLNLDLDVTPDAEVQLVIDSRTGDIIRGRGSGRLNMRLRPNEDFRINGDYVISSGDYLFTLGNILNKRFVVEEGSRISWNGNIADADIDIRAIHRVDASLHEILRDERFRERIPVECVLLLSENLTSPQVRFDINLPTADEQTRSYLRNAINSDEEMSLQFVYLLIMRQFYPDPSYMSGSAFPTSSLIGTSALGSGFEMVFNQMANWLSQISNDFDVGFTYRPGNEISPDELELALSTQILNDRVIINGNIDVAGNQHSATSNTFSGDFDVEFVITEKVRFNFFNRSNINLLYETAPYTQGIGLMFRHEFDRFRLGLFNRSEKVEAIREEEPLPVNIESNRNDSR